MMTNDFWNKLKKPIVGMAPMDGITDAAMRFITKKYGGVEVMFTEFVSAEGIKAGAVRLFGDLKYDESERPIAAQLFGVDLGAFYLASVVVGALGFDGVDINMGCPVKSVAGRGGGASLIKNPGLAGEIVEEVKRGVKDWAEGVELKELDLDRGIIEYIEGLGIKRERRLIPVSVKTRIGYEEVDFNWVKRLAEFGLAVISVHGRTFKQGYQGRVAWEAMRQMAEEIKDSSTLFLGNGEIRSLAEGRNKAEKYGLDGVLIGRGAKGNPWVFLGAEVDVKSRLLAALEHGRKFEELFPGESFLPMRKHLSWYARGFARAKQLRQKLVLANSSKEVEEIVRGLNPEGLQV